MAWRAGFQFVATACCGPRESKADKQYEEQGNEEAQIPLERGDLDKGPESLDHFRAQDLLLRVEAYNNRELQVEVEEELQDNTQVQMLHSLDYAISDRENIELEYLVQGAPPSQDYAVIGPIESHMDEREARITQPTTIAPQHSPTRDSAENTTGQIVDPVEASSIRKLDLLNVLSESKEICDRIMSLLFPGDSINIREYVNGQAIRPCHACGQVKYFVADRNFFNYVRSRHSTTYFASQNSEVLDIARITKYRPSCDFSPRVLGVNQMFRSLGSIYLYRRDFRFQCSAEGAKQFLTQNSLRMCYMTQVDLFYHFRNEPLVVETNGEALHSLMSEIRHKFAYIPRMHVHVGHGFWAKADWAKGPAAVTGQRSLRDDGEYRPPFPCDIAKVAAPADRWKDHEDLGTHCTRGTEVEISIEGTMSEEEVEFVEQLNEEILRRGRTRPFYHKSLESPYVWRRSLCWKRPYTCTEGEKVKRWESD